MTRRDTATRDRGTEDHTQAPDGAQVLRRIVRSAQRGINEEKRSASFVAATENPVATWWGPEVLRMSGLDMRDYLENPVVLDSHRLHSALDVIGRAVNVRVSGRKLHLDVEFSDDEDGEKLWRKVRGGFIRALSIGYVVDRKKIRELREGETDGEGAAMVKGPAIVVPKWRLYEVSLVSVPADPGALMRARSAFYGGDRKPPTEERSMTIQYGAVPGIGAATAAAPAAPAPAAPAAPAAPPATTAAPTALDHEAQVRALALEEARARTIRSLASEDNRTLAEDLILRGASVEDARKAMLEARTKAAAPVGTPPAPAPTPPPTQNPPPAAPAMQARSFAAALTGR